MKLTKLQEPSPTDDRSDLQVFAPKGKMRGSPLTHVSTKAEAWVFTRKARDQDVKGRWTGSTSTPLRLSLTEVELGFHPGLTKLIIAITYPAKPPSAAIKHAHQVTTIDTATNTITIPHATIVATLSPPSANCRASILQPRYHTPRRHHPTHHLLTQVANRTRLLARPSRGTLHPPTSQSEAVDSNPSSHSPSTA